MKKLIPILALTLLLLNVAPARADIAPPATPPGANLEPGTETTQVRMVAETVLIEVLANTPANSLGRAQVTADFSMRNLGSASESMAVRFPISASDGWSRIVEIGSFQVQVNGKGVQTRRISGEDPLFGSEAVPWAEFDATFPPGEDIDIRVSYLLEGMGEYPFVSFKYLLSTGAAWKDTIGSADLVVRLPYKVNEQNVILDEQIGWSMTTGGAALEGNEVRWSFSDFEPTYEHNLDIALVMPAVWRRALEEQQNITKNPKDGEAWGRLGKLYKEMTFLRRSMRADIGGQALYELSGEAYQECLRLLPGDALWHAGYADLRYRHYLLDTYWKNPDDYTEIVAALEALNTALAIDPNTPKALELLDEMSYSVPGAVVKNGERYDLLFLTATPPAPTATATSRTAPEATPVITETPAAATPSASPTTARPETARTPCGALLLAPLALFAPQALRRWRGFSRA